jgi:hypothetical protein
LYYLLKFYPDLGSVHLIRYGRFCYTPERGIGPLLDEEETSEAEDDNKDDDEPNAVAAAKNIAHNRYLLKIWPLKAHSIVFRRARDVTFR